MNWYIFRHGKTAFSGKTPWQDRSYGSKTETAEILPEGIPVLKRLGKYLKDIATDFNVSSPYLRCKQTVAIVGNESGKHFTFDPLLHDIDHRVEKPWDTAKRITAFYKELTTHNPPHTSVCVCTHGYPIAMLKSLILTGKVNLLRIMDYPTTGVLLSIVDGKVSYEDFNDK
jgi:broad specificity phosphatase PhoE